MGIFDRIKSNSKKTKTEKFLILKKLIEMFQLGIKNINSIMDNVNVYSPSLKEDLEIANFNNQLKKDLDNIDEYWREIMLFVENKIRVYSNEEFSKDITKSCLVPLKENTISLSAFSKNYDLLLKKLEFKKQILESIERNLIALEKNDFSYFENMKKN